MKVLLAWWVAPRQEMCANFFSEGGEGRGGSNSTSSKQKFHYGSPMVPLWFPMVPLWFPCGSPMVAPWFPCSSPMVPLWFPHGSTMVPPWFPCGSPMVPLWFLYRNTLQEILMAATPQQVHSIGYVSIHIKPPARAETVNHRWKHSLDAAQVMTF